MSEFQSVVDAARERGMGFLIEQNGWKDAKSTNDIKVESRPSDKLNCSVYRATIWAPVSFEDVVATYPVHYANKRLEWDTDMNRIKLLKQITDTRYVQVLHSNAVAKGVISAREFVVINETEKTDDQIIYFGASVDIPDLPIADGHVRGVVGCVLLKIDKDPSRPGMTRIVYINEFDFKGRLPKSILDSVSPGLIVASTETWLKYLAKNGMTKP